MCKPELLRGRLERGPGRCWRGGSSSGRGDEFSRRDLHPINIASPSWPRRTGHTPTQQRAARAEGLEEADPPSRGTPAGHRLAGVTWLPPAMLQAAPGPGSRGRLTLHTQPSCPTLTLLLPRQGTQSHAS